MSDYQLITEPPQSIEIIEFHFSNLLIKLEIIS